MKLFHGKLLKKYGKKLNITTEKTQEKTGKFDISLDGETIHTFQDDGWPDTDEKLKKIYDAIDAKLAELGK